MVPRCFSLILQGATLFIALAACVTAAPAPSPQLAEILRKIDFHAAAKPDVLGKALAELPPSDLATLCDMLVEPGAGDDTKPRMALEGLAWYTGSHGTPAQRTAYINTLTAALAKDHTPGVTAFLIRQLQLMGDESAAATLERFLLDDQVYDFAAQALTAIGGDAAREAFHTAYPEAHGPCRVAIIQGIGLLGDHESVDRLAEDAANQDPEIRFAALAALANLGAPAFSDAAHKSDCRSRYERAQLDALVFRMSERSAERGEAEGGADLTAELYSPDPQVRTAALLGTTGPKAVGLAISFLADEDAEVRAAAANFAVSMSGEGITEAFLDKLPEAPEPVRAALVDILGKRGDSAALGAVLNTLQDTSKPVRLAAVNAAATLGRASAVEPLVKLLDSDDDEQCAAVQQALTQIREGDAAAQIAAVLSTSPPRVQVALLKVLAASHALGQAPAICGCLDQDDQTVRLAALQAVETLAPPSALNPLVALLPKLDNPQQREACESALTAVCRRTTDRAGLCKKLTAALHKDRAEDYCSLLRVLGKIGGADAFQTIRQSLNDSRAQVAEAAYRALSTWPDPATAADILQVAASATEIRNHVLAFRAYIRLVGANQDLSVADKLADYEKCIALARRAEERKLLLSKIGELPDGRTVAVLQRFLLDDQLRNEAGAALLTVAERLLPAGWQNARQAIWLALDAVDDDALRQRGQTLLQRVSEYEDFITDWQVAGPYEEGGLSGLELLDMPFPPEQPGATGVDWQKQVATTGRPDFWYVDLNANPGMAGSNRVAYLRTHIDSPRTQDVQLELGSDDALKVWLNGKLIHTFAGVRGCERGQDKVAARLQKGRNELLLKVANGGGGWAACLRVRQPDGSHIEGLKIDWGQ